MLVKIKEICRGEDEFTVSPYSLQSYVSNRWHSTVLSYNISNLHKGKYWHSIGKRFTDRPIRLKSPGGDSGNILFFGFLCNMINNLTNYTQNNNTADICPNRNWKFKRLHIKTLKDILYISIRIYKI
jgi:hypothetical protein